MSNIISHQANGREYLLITEGEFTRSRYLTPSFDIRFHFPSSIAPYTWSIIGKASELSEQQAAEIVGDDDLVYNGEWLYPNFANPEKSFTYPQAWKESLSSLLSSLGMGEGNTLILVKQ